jgi:enoyl-CoA hydratase/carnithine racemase
MLGRMTDGTIRLSHDGHVAILTLDRPERRNALGEGMWTSLEARIAELERHLPRAVVVTGEGDRAFCAGQDLGGDNPQVQGLVSAVQSHDERAVEAFLARERRVADRLFALPVPLVAAVNGVAFGGGAEIATRCDLRVLDPSAVICFSEVTLGLMPDWGGGVALTRLLGPGRAADLILTGRRVDAEESLRLGFTNRISAKGQSVAEAVELGRAIARNGPRAVRSALEVIRRTPALSDEEALALEMRRAITLIASGECVHGITAFMSKQPPEFPDPGDGLE